MFYEVLKGVKMTENAVLESPKEFVDALSYPAKKYRPLCKRPVSVPYDPIITDFTPIKSKKYEPQNYSMSLFFTAFDVRDYGPEIKKFMKIYSNVPFKRIYLETYRDGYEAESGLLKKTRDTLIKEGYSVSAAVTTTHFSDRAKFNEIESAAGCYTDREALRKMRGVFERTAKIFNEIIIDDWFFTVCRCPSCLKGMGERDVSKFRMKLMADAAKKHIIEPAKKANKKVKLIIKYPQWLEDFHKNGYDTVKLSDMFDEIAVGTETRDYKTGRYMPVHGSMLMRYFRELYGDRVKKAWFDPYACDPKIYAEQAYQSVIGGASELILFCAGILAQKNIRPLVAELMELAPKIDRFSSMQKIFNIPVIKKPATEGDSMLTQYLMMSGVPAYLTNTARPKDKFVVLTAQSSDVPGRAALFAELVKKKKDMLITVAFAASVKKYFGIKELPAKIKAETLKYNGRTTNIHGEAYITHEMQSGKHMALINGAYPFISAFKIKESRVYVLNMPESTGKINNITGGTEPADYRYLLQSSGMLDALKAVFKNYCVLALYDRIKTYFKHAV